MLVCVFSVLFARETAGAARTRSSLRPLTTGGGTFPLKTRATCAARSRSRVLQLFLSVVITRFGVIQYSRDVGDRAEKPRRTGYPAFAGYDGSGWRATPKSNPRPRRLPWCRA